MKTKPQILNLNEKELSVDEAIKFTGVFLDQVIDFITDVNFGNEAEINELKGYIYATRMYYLKSLQIIERERKNGPQV